MPFERMWKDDDKWEPVSEVVLRNKLEDNYYDIDLTIESMKASPGEVFGESCAALYRWVA